MEIRLRRFVNSLSLSVTSATSVKGVTISSVDSFMYSSSECEFSSKEVLPSLNTIALDFYL